MYKRFDAIALADLLGFSQTLYMATLVFLHGLNTFGTDDLRIGPMNFGLMHSRLEEEFAKRDIDFIGVTGVGSGSPEEQAENASKFLARSGFLDAHDETGRPFVFLGHSAGGLTARALALRPEFKNRVKMVITMGTPHAGAKVAELGLELDKRHPVILRALAAAGYDTKKKTAIFNHFTPDAVAAFNQRAPAITREVTLLCEATRNELSWPYYFSYKQIHPTPGVKSDGFIESDSQKRGEVIGPFAVDHYGEMGFFFQLSLSARKQAQSEFQRLIDQVTQLANS